MIDSLNQTVQKYSEIVYIISSNVLQYSEISMYTRHDANTLQRHSKMVSLLQRTRVISSLCVEEYFWAILYFLCCDALYTIMKIFPNFWCVIFENLKNDFVSNRSKLENICLPSYTSSPKMIIFCVNLGPWVIIRAFLNLEFFAGR